MAHECPLHPSACEGAMRCGHLDTLERVLANGCSWPWNAGDLAAVYGHVHILEWMLTSDRALDKERMCVVAAMGGKLSSLTWARANGCPWDIHVCSEAASKGYLEILIWAHRNGCPWHEKTYAYAAAAGHLDILQWVQAQGLPL
ncbi:unnamed protein product [Laminaria digitata]